MWHTYLETLQEFQSHHRIGYWLNYTEFPGDVYVAFFNVLPGNKDAVAPTPSSKKKAFVFTTYQDQLNAECM